MKKYHNWKYNLFTISGTTVTFVTLTCAQTVWQASLQGDLISNICLNLNGEFLTGWRHFPSSKLPIFPCQGVIEVATGQLRERIQPEGRWLALSVTCTVSTPLSFLFLSHLTNDKKELYQRNDPNNQNFWILINKNINHSIPGGSKDVPTERGGDPDGQEHQWCRWLPWTTNHWAGLRMLFYNVSNYMGRMNKSLCLSVQWAQLKPKHVQCSPFDHKSGQYCCCLTLARRDGPIIIILLTRPALPLPLPLPLALPSNLQMPRIPTLLRLINISEDLHALGLINMTSINIQHKTLIF